jgi:hypothetical protein
MPYHDDRSLTEKLQEHRFWNTHDLPHESQGPELARQLIAAASAIPAPFSWDSVAQGFDAAVAHRDQETIIGMVRLLVFCAGETPNRFKAIFPAFLIESGLASTPADGSGMVWGGGARTLVIDVETLARSRGPTWSTGRWKAALPSRSKSW